MRQAHQIITVKLPNVTLDKIDEVKSRRFDVSRSTIIKEGLALLFMLEEMPLKRAAEIGTLMNEAAELSAREQAETEAA